MADQWRKGDKASSVAYGAALITSLTIFGALAIELKDLVNGKDPRPMNTLKFWAAAYSQGGGLGIFGDFMYTGLGGSNRAGSPNWASFFGPVFGSAVDLANLPTAAMRDKVGAEALRFARGHMPFVNLWYAKSAIDHAGLQDLQEMLSPGYLARMRQTAMKEWGQDYWWRPSQGAPARAPDFGNIIGR